MYLRRNKKLTKLYSIVLFVLFLQMCFYVSSRIFYDDFRITFLNETSSDYRFIKERLATASEGSWQNVSDSMESTNKFFAFSAFLDNRLNDNVILIAAARTKPQSRKKIWCKFWYQIEGTLRTNYYSVTIRGVYKVIMENWNLAYSAYYIECPLNKELPVPDAVSLVKEPDETPQNIFRVIVNFVKPPEWDVLDLPPTFNNLAVCVKPLHYDYNEVMEILEFIELHQLMGVNQFFFYNHTIGDEVNCLLNDYVKEGIVTMLPWKLPLVSQKEIRTEGIFAALNDCLYRTMHLYSHVLFIDFDEFIIPRNHNTYEELFTYLNSTRDLKNTGAFVFRNAFFYRQWQDDLEINNFNDPLAASLLVLKKTKRIAKLHAHRVRSKYIARPELVNMVGNHFVWQFAVRKKLKSLNVPSGDGIMHHYRTCEFGGDDCVKQESVVDKSAYRYKDDLVRAVKRRFEKHGTECKLRNFLSSS